MATRFSTNSILVSFIFEKKKFGMENVHYSENVNIKMTLFDELTVEKNCVFLTVIAKKHIILILSSDTLNMNIVITYFI